MATRNSRSSGGSRRRGRRWAVFSLAALAISGGLIWIAPTVLVLTALRDRPLQALFAGVDGSVSSRAARWDWLGSSEYRDVMLCDSAGRSIVAVRRVIIDRGLVALAFDPTRLGTVRLIGAKALVEVRRGGSGLEDILAPWLAARSQAPTRPGVSFELELVDASIELIDTERRDVWKISELIAAGTVRADETLAGWTMSGRVSHAGAAIADSAGSLGTVPPPAGPRATSHGSHLPAEEVAEKLESSQLDRTTIAAGATLMLARDGGWSVSSPAALAADGPRSLAIATNRVPLGVSSVLATRFDLTHVLDGLADVRLDIVLPVAGGQQPAGLGGGSESVAITGMIAGSQLAICHADTLAEIITLNRCEIPLDVSLNRQMLTIRNLKATSPLFKAEASGRMRVPQGGSWELAEALIHEDFALAADIDLAAASRAIPGGLTVRPDVRVTDGQLQLSATAHADGTDRLLEVRLTSSDLAAVQSVALPVAVSPSGQPQPNAQPNERLLRWNQPFTAWLRGRRGPARTDSIRIEEARIASPAVEVSAAGTAESSSIQWMLDIDKLMKEAAEVLDLQSLQMAGTARGKIDMSRVAATGVSTAKISASLNNFELIAPGRPAWRDQEITLEAEGSGSMAGGAVLLDQAPARVMSADDTLEWTLTGGTLIDLSAGLGRVSSGLSHQTISAPPWVRAAQNSVGISADCSLSGELANWQARFEGLMPGIDCGDLELAGKMQLSAALAARGDSWQITRAGGEIEKLVAKFSGREVAEPRVVASAAGLYNPASGQLEISSGEILTATMSLRTGGVVLLAISPGMVESAGRSLMDRLRGKVQWQADVGRVEKWLVSPLAAASWPTAGRAWGTVELLDTQAGLNLRVEATGNQLSLLSAVDAGASGIARPATPKQIWAEPRAAVVLEVTQNGTSSQAKERLTINKLSLESSTLAVAATGSVGEWSARPLVDLNGTVAYDWDLLSRLLTPWTGGRIRLIGGSTRPFALRGPLTSSVQTAIDDRRSPEGSSPPPRVIAGDNSAGIPIPDHWLKTTQGPDESETKARARVALPVATATRTGGNAADFLRAISIDTSTVWTAAEIEGVSIDAGEMAVRLFEGQLALGPFDIGAAGGRLRGAPWVRLMPWPGELIVPPGRVVDRVALSNGLCDRFVAWIAPLVGHSSHSEGLLSVDLAGARLPLGDFFGGELSGQMLFENFEVTPGPQAQPLVNLIVKLQSLIDPRFAFGDKTVLMRIRPDPVRVKLVDRRLWHDGLVMEMGQLTVRTDGSVGADGSLSMMTEVSFRGDIAGGTPIVGQLLRTPLAIPLRGTLNRPQWDAGALDKILSRIVENTAQAVLTDGIGRGLNGLETLFGNPQPPAPQSPQERAAP